MISNCLKNNRKSQKELYESILPCLESVCRRYLRNESDLGDALQISFVKIFKNLKLFNPTISSLQTWSCKIAINTCLNLNSQRKRSFTEEFNVEIHDSLTNPIVEKIETEELLNWLKQMPEDYFIVFNLFVVDGFSHIEISRLLGITEALSRKRLSRGRSWIKNRVINDRFLISDLKNIIYN